MTTDPFVTGAAPTEKSTINFCCFPLNKIVKAYKDISFHLMALCFAFRFTSIMSL